MTPTARLSIEAIRRRLHSAVVGRHLYLFEKVDSTSRALRNLARAGAAEGTAVLAESQSDGRGRMGQPWFSPAGTNLYVSVLFHADAAPRTVGVFSFIASLAVADAIRDLGLSPTIKWPNDVLVRHKKVAGTLTECSVRGDRVEFVVLGVGVNLNVSPEALAAALGPAAAWATSLAEALGVPVDRNAFAASYLNHLDAWARRFRQDGAGPILDAWRDRDILTARRVEIRAAPGPFLGRVLGVDEEGHLLVANGRGERHTVISEEVRVLD
jgi:BirA family biotin operon repressor/biotin-[acetyl-CoA-carboxylase] ligase